MGIDQMVEEEDGADSEEDKLEILKKKKITGPEEEMKMKDGSMDREVEDLELEEEEEEEVREDTGEIEKTAGRINPIYLHLLRREAWLGQEATPNH